MNRRNVNKKYKQFERIGELLEKLEQIVEEELGAKARVECIKHFREIDVELATLKKGIAQGDYKAAKAIFEKSLVDRNRQILLAEIEVLLEKHFGKPIGVDESKTLITEAADLSSS